MKINSNTFNLYATYYDILYADKNYKSEVDYIENLIHKYNLNTKKILDLGCGTGIHALMLATDGYHVHGVDRSAAMIEQAKSRVEQNFMQNNIVKFDVGEIRGLKLNSKFDAVISIFHVASYLTTNQDIQSFFIAASRHLDKHGILIFDFWYGPAVLTQKPGVRIKRLENENFKIVRISEPVQDFVKNTVDVNYDIFIQHKNENRIEKISEIHKMRYFFIPELEVFAAQSGFEILSIEEWLTGKYPAEQSWGVCGVFIKNDNPT